MLEHQPTVWPVPYNSCSYTRLLPEVALWVIVLGLDWVWFLPVRFSPLLVTLQITTQGQLLAWQ